mmetsp:Transcript_29798/g.39776  ORF Transcript_29798/g.39776 Transcript_29798/m.39776 type:complete len:81 (+) Transcript_29798:839-1081(+)
MSRRTVRKAAGAVDDERRTDILSWRTGCVDTCIFGPNGAQNVGSTVVSADGFVPFSLVSGVVIMMLQFSGKFVNAERRYY